MEHWSQAKDVYFHGLVITLLWIQDHFFPIKIKLEIEQEKGDFGHKLYGTGTDVFAVISRSENGNKRLFRCWQPSKI